MKQILLTFCIYLLCSSNIHAQNTSSFISKNNMFNTDVFIENRGQYAIYEHDAHILFGVDHIGPKLFFTKNAVQVVYDFAKYDGHEAHEALEEAAEEGNQEEYDELVKKYANNLERKFLQMQWQGCNENVVIETYEKSGNYYSYGSEQHIAYGYKKIRYQNLYPGIDVEYIIDEEQGVKYNLYVKPGADLSQVRMQYTGDLTSMQLEEGKLKIKIHNEYYSESVPISTYENGTIAHIEYKLEGNEVVFIQKGKKEKTETLVIDPWIVPITSLTGATYAANKGFDVDFDYDGNLFVFGGGAYNTSPQNQRLAKYTSTGALLWTFMGGLTSPFVWDLHASYGYAGNFVVDKASGKCYLSQGFNPTAGEVIRINDLGLYDGWRNIPDSRLNEGWELFYDCNTGSVMITGGSTASNRNISTLNATSGAMTLYTFTGIAGGFQDILNSVSDRPGNIYVVLASSSVPGVNNRLYKLNAGYSSFAWSSPTGYASFNEADNKPYYRLNGSNGFNALAVNDSFLYYYDGLNLKAFNKSTGSTIGTPLAIAGHTVKQQGGIAIDDCNNIYIGSNNGNIKVYHFTGTTFTAQPDVTIPGYSGRAVYDIRYNQNNNLLYICGNGFTGIIAPPFVCTSSTLLDSVSVNCDRSAVAHILVPDSLATYSYVWQDTLSLAIVRANYNTPNTRDTLTGIIPGRTYLLTVVKNLICGGIRTTHHIFLPNEVINQTITLCPGDTLAVGPRRYTSAGTYRDTLLSVYGCDSIVNTILSYGPYFIFTQNVSLCPGRSITVGTHTYTSAGTYRDTFSRAGGLCDSITITNLSFRPNTLFTRTIRICPGGYVVVGSRVYTTAGTYRDTMRNYLGCDSILTTILIADTIPIFRQTINLCNGRSYSIGTSTYTSAGTYTATISRGGACDSQVITTIVMIPSSTRTLSYSICFGDTVYVSGVPYALAGTYRDTLLAYNGCDSFLTINISYTSAIPTRTQVPRICAGYSFTFNGNTYTSAGTYRDTVRVPGPGCDSVVTTILLVDPNFFYTQNRRICAGQSITVGTHVYNVSGTYRDTFRFSTRCDSILTTNLTVDTLARFIQNIIRCTGETYTINGHTYSTSGTYYDTILRTGTCDSIVTTILVVNPISNRTIDTSFCAGFTLRVGTSTYTTSGTRYDTLNNYIGCDSIIRSILIVYPNVTSTQNITRCAGDSVYAGGMWRFTSGTYFDTLTNSRGCDSTLTTILTIHSVLTGIRNVSICLGTSYYCGGALQNTSGTYFDTTTSFIGCDSIIQTNLTINPILQGTRSISICLGTSYFCGGANQTSSGTYYDSLTNSSGCDSVIQTILTINPILQGTRTIQICNGDSVWLASAWQFTAGSYYDSLTNTNGCDSVLRNILVVHNANTATQNINRCVGKSFFCGGANQTTSGTYYDTLNTIYGCDSILITTLNINPLPPINAGNDTSICYNQSARLSATGSGTFLWNNGSSSANIIVTPSISTLYTVTITDGFGCKNTDSVVVNIMPLPIIGVSDTTVCRGESANIYATGGVQYTWLLPNGTTGTANPYTTSVQNTTSFKVYVVGTNGCIDSSNARIAIAPALVNIVASPDEIIRRGTTLTLTADLLNSSDVIIGWEPIAMLSSATGNPVSSNPNTSQWYYITTQNSAGCIARDSIFIEVLPVDDIIAPTAFSPNGDGINDIFRVILSPYLQLQEFVIFNRWGEQVFAYTASNAAAVKGWNGVYKEREQPLGTYVWYATAVSSRTGEKIIKKGNVTLMR